MLLGPLLEQERTVWDERVVFGIRQVYGKGEKVKKWGYGSTNFCYDTTIWRQLTDREIRRIAIEQIEQAGLA